MLRNRIWHRLNLKQKPEYYMEKDSNLKREIRTIDLIGLGIGMVVGTAIFTLPGIVAAKYSGPAVIISFLVGAVGAGLSALAYGEMASVLPFAGSAFSWISVLFGEFWGWIVGWALLAEYFISVAFVASGWSVYMRSFLESLGIKIPNIINGGFNLRTGSIIDIFAALAILLVACLLSRGVSQASKIENIIVGIKLAVIVLFVIIGVTEVHVQNYLPFIPPHRAGTNFGGVQGILAGASQIFIAYVGFDAIAANAAETKNPEKSMPIGLLGTLILGTTLFVIVSLVLVGMFKYSVYFDNAVPASWALRETGHYIAANLLSVIALVGLFSALIAVLLAASRLIYSFGRDCLLPTKLGNVNDKHMPNYALWVITGASIILGSILPFDFLSSLVSAGTLVAFIFVSLGIYALRPREGKDLPKAKFKVPLYPILPALSALFSLMIFLNLNVDAKILIFVWLLLGVVVYILYGYKHSVLVNQESDLD
ncbi:APC family permease [Latilactobacillus sakei]|uniref:APC family permease n=1 Tax=Latilactobacillus sakei TaxID=1599 RepID=UPI0038854479